MNGPNDRKDPKAEAGKLIGGYATGNLTNAEKRILHEAALQDQELFDALMDEQALKDLLEAPGIKKELIAALQPKVTLWGKITNWMKTPIALGAAGALATAAVLLVVVATRPTRYERVVQTSKMEPAVSQPAIAANPENERRQDVAARQPLDMAKKIVAPPVAAGQVAPVPLQPPQPERAADAKREEQLPAAVATERDQQRAGGPTASQAVNSQAVQQAPYAQQMNQAAPAAPAPPSIFAAVPTVLSVEYSLLRRNAEGRFEPVTAGSVRSDDALRLQVTPNSNGILSLSRSDENGIQTPIAGSIAVNRGQAVTLPAQGSFTAIAVDEKLVLTLTDHASMQDAFSKSAGATALRQRAQSVKARKDVDRSVASEVGRLDTVGKKVVLPAATTRTSADSADSHQLVIEIAIRAQ